MYIWSNVLYSQLVDKNIYSDENIEDFNNFDPFFGVDSSE